MAETYEKFPTFLLIVGGLIVWGVMGGCGTIGGHSASQTPAPLRIVVGPVILEAPITSSAQIRSFEEAPPPEVDSVLLSQLKDEIQVRAQRFLTEHLARESGFDVVAFDETRRILADLAPPGTMLTDKQVNRLGYQTGADIVITGRIHDYGKVRWQYWVTGWFAHLSAWTTAIGAATAWNPAAIGAFLAVDATTDFPIWYGGAEIFGWAFRPVRVHLDAFQLKNCEGLIWTDDALRVRVPGKDLAEYPPERQKRKEVQLEANLKGATGEIAETAGEKLAIQACTEDGKPKEIGGFSFASVFDLLI